VPQTAGQDQWEDVTPGPVIAAGAARAPKQDEEWEDATPAAQTFPPGSYQTKKGGPIENINTKKPVTAGTLVGDAARGALSAVGIGPAKPGESLASAELRAGKQFISGAGRGVSQANQEAGQLAGEGRFGPASLALTVPNLLARGAESIATGIEHGSGDILSGDSERMAHGAGEVAMNVGPIARDIPEAVRSGRDALGTAMRTEQGALKPGVKTVAKLGGAGLGTLAGSTVGAPSGGAVVGGMVGPGIVDVIAPKRPPSSGVAPTLPDAGEFYEKKAEDLTRRGKEQAAIDRKAARDERTAAKSRVSIVSEGGNNVADPRTTGSEGRPATWKNAALPDMAKRGSRPAIEQLTRRGLPLPENSRYVMGDQDFPRSVINPREVTRFAPDGTPIRDVANPTAQNPSSRARIQIVSEQPTPEAPSAQEPLNFAKLPEPGRTIPKIEQPAAAVNVSANPTIPTVEQLEDALYAKGMRAVEAHKLAVDTIKTATGEYTLPEGARKGALERIERVMGPDTRAAAREPVHIGKPAPAEPAKPLTQKQVQLAKMEDRPATEKTPRTREPREQLQNFDPETLEMAKAELEEANGKWQTFERPGRYFTDTDIRDNEAYEAPELTHAVPSSRPQMEGAHPWLKNLPKMTAEKLRAAIESGKGVEYTRLLNEAGKHIQAVKEANAPLVEEFRDQLETAAKSVERINPELAQNLRDVAAGKYSGVRKLASFLKDRLNEAAATAAEYEEAHADAKSEKASEGVQERNNQGAEPRQGNLKATELGPPKPKNPRVPGEE
jgi:hypothetical protein